VPQSGLGAPGRGGRGSTARSDDWNAYLRRVHGETVGIIHPCHPLVGKRVSVIHYRRDRAGPAVVVELPDRSLQCMPERWTDRARPDPCSISVSPASRFSAHCLLEVADLLESWRNEH